MSFTLARLKGRSVPPVRELDVASGAAFEKGALLVQDANGDWAECGVDPATVGAVAESGYGANTSGFGSIGGRKEFPPNRMLGTLVQGETRFRAEFVGTLPAAVGGSYGVIRDTDNRWKVDFAETVNTRVKYLRQIPEELPGTPTEVEVVFLSANVQIL